MVRCADGSLYTGFARDPKVRVAVHNEGKGAKYTRSRLPLSLVYTEQCESLSAALKRERQLKSSREERGAHRRGSGDAEATLTRHRADVLAIRSGAARLQTKAGKLFEHVRELWA